MADSEQAATHAVENPGRRQALKSLTPAAYAAVDALTDTLIPTDAHSPGAQAARVADYIDLLLSESAVETRTAWDEGIAAIGGLARTRPG
ncbi:MAG: gluconate 2-dehydrogenase subunit 3 family protein [Vicinamibacteraceae bacterium]